MWRSHFLMVIDCKSRIFNTQRNLSHTNQLSHRHLEKTESTFWWMVFRFGMVRVVHLRRGGIRIGFMEEQFFSFE